MSTEDKVIAIIAEQALLEPKDLSADSALDDLAMDSSSLVECIFALEEEFDIAIPFTPNASDHGGFDMSNIGAIVSGVDALIAAKP